MDHEPEDWDDRLQRCRHCGARFIRGDHEECPVRVRAEVDDLRDELAEARTRIIELERLGGHATDCAHCLADETERAVKMLEVGEVIRVVTLGYPRFGFVEGSTYARVERAWADGRVLEVNRRGHRTVLAQALGDRWEFVPARVGHEVTHG